MNDTDLYATILDLERLERGDWSNVSAETLRPVRVLALAREVEILRRTVAAMGAGSHAGDPMPDGPDGDYLTTGDTWEEGYNRRQWEERRWIDAARHNIARAWDREGDAK